LRYSGSSGHLGWREAVAANALAGEEALEEGEGEAAVYVVVNPPESRVFTQTPFPRSSDCLGYLGQKLLFQLGRKDGTCVKAAYDLSAEISLTAFDPLRNTASSRTVSSES
jgi:hypothetical protein